MKFLLWLLGLFTLAVALVLAAHHYPGYVTLTYPNGRITVSLALFVLVMLALGPVLFIATQLISGAIRLPEQARRFRAERMKTKQHEAATEALTAFFEGRLATAERAAEQAIELGDDSSITPIIAARAAHELRKFDKRDAYLAATENNPDAVVMRLLARAEFDLAQHHPANALATLKTLRESGQRVPIGALRLELRAQRQAHNWDAMLELTDQLEKRDALDADYVAELRQQAWLEKLKAAPNTATLQAAWKSVPAAARPRTPIAIAAARAFIHLHDFRGAQQIITDSLTANWDSALAALYGDAAGDDTLKQIEQAERWLLQHRRDDGLLLTLGKLCLRQKLWGKAQSYLDASISIAPSRAAYMALWQMAEQLHKPNDALGYFQKAMELEDPAE